MQRFRPHCQPQSHGPPPKQLPALQWSFTVQTLASLQEPESRIVRPQVPVRASQASSVHGLASSQLTGALTQSSVIGSQVSVVHGLPSSQLRAVP